MLRLSWTSTMAFLCGKWCRPNPSRRRPTRASLGRFGARQGDQLGFLLAVENTLHGWRLALFAVQNRLEALLYQLLAHAVDHGRAGVQGRDDLVVAPSWPCLRDIGLQQDARLQHPSRRPFSLSDQFLKLLAFLAAQPHNVLLC